MITATENLYLPPCHKKNKARDEGYESDASGVYDTPRSYCSGSSSTLANPHTEQTKRNREKR